MKKKNLKSSLFEKVMIIVAFLIISIIFIAITTILIQGLPYIGQAFCTDEVIFAIRLSLYTASVSTIICIILAIPTAYALTKTNMPFKRVSQMLLELPLSLPYLILGLSLLLIFSSDFGKGVSEIGFKVVFSKKGIILAWSRALGEFEATLMLVGTTRMKTETLPASIYLNMATGDMGAAMASAVILLLISAISQFLFNGLNRKADKNRIKFF